MVVGQWFPVTVGGVGGRRLLVRVAQQGGAGQGGGVVAPVGHAGLVTPHLALTLTVRHQLRNWTSQGGLPCSEGAP